MIHTCLILSRVTAICWGPPGVSTPRPTLWMPPKAQCTRLLWSSLQVVGPCGGEPLLFIRAEPGRAPWVKVRPLGVPKRAPPPGLAPGWGPGDPCQGEGHWALSVFVSIGVNWIAHCLTHPPQDQFALGDPTTGKQQGPCNHWSTQTPPWFREGWRWWLKIPEILSRFRSGLCGGLLLPETLFHDLSLMNPGIVILVDACAMRKKKCWWNNLFVQYIEVVSGLHSLDS